MFWCRLYVILTRMHNAYSPNIVVREILCAPLLLTRNRMTVMYPSSRPSNNLQSEINSVDMSRLESNASDSPKCFFQIFHRELRLHFIFFLCVLRICNNPCIVIVMKIPNNPPPPHPLHLHQDMCCRLPSPSWRPPLDLPPVLALWGRGVRSRDNLTPALLEPLEAALKQIFMYV